MRMAGINDEQATMGIQLCVLGSGSSGNCIYLAVDDVVLLVDAGLSARETQRRLHQVAPPGTAPTAVCLTHEHGDHTRGLAVLQKRYGMPVYANSGTIEGYGRMARNGTLDWRVFATGSPFRIGPVRVEPFSVPHDAYEPVGFIFEAQGVRAGIVTDMGVATSLIIERLRSCDLLVIESNHDERMLQEAPRPWSLKQRIRGRQGHLSNRHAADLLVAAAGERLRQVFLAHLSSECNTPHLAAQEIRRALLRNGRTDVAITCAHPDRVSELWPQTS